MHAEGPIHRGAIAHGGSGLILGRVAQVMAREVVQCARLGPEWCNAHSINDPVRIRAVQCARQVVQCARLGGRTLSFSIGTMCAAKSSKKTAEIPTY